MTPGQTCEGMAFALQGSLRVYLVGMDGREITLYRVQAGESCVLSAACILGNRHFPASAEIESDLSGLLVPAQVFRDWVGTEPFWREYVFGLLGERLAAVLAQFEATVFDPVESRLARWLLNAATGDPLAAATTQQALANELGSAREVINRVLNRWRNAGWVSLDRGVVQILQVSCLRGLANR
jgi:CRP/FNR family transcriptional regulator